MKRRWRRLCYRALVLTFGLVAAMPLYSTRTAVTQTEGDMAGWHPIGIENETQRKLFFSLICMCGCPRETLGTCNCNFAHERREELKAALASGMSVEQIQDAYAKRWGPQSLAVPPNSGANWLLWAAPLAAIVLGAFGLIVLIRRWRNRGGPPPGPPPAGGAADDEYDAKLDRELSELDRE
jgi:cytochrome c-type biogenesis protein CcmH/NrfF